MAINAARRGEQVLFVSKDRNKLHNNPPVCDGFRSRADLERIKIAFVNNKKTKQNKTKQNKTKQNKTKQNKTKQKNNKNKTRKVKKLHQICRSYFYA